MNLALRTKLPALIMLLCFAGCGGGSTGSGRRGAVNRPPTLAMIPDQAIGQVINVTSRTVTLRNVSPGPANESGQRLTFNAMSSNTSLVTVSMNNAVSRFNAMARTATLTYTQVAGTTANGTATITVRVMDNGGTANGGVNFVTQSFTVTVNAAPSFTLTGMGLNTTTAPASLTVTEDSGANTAIVISNISPAFPGIRLSSSEMNQTVSLTATANTPGIILNPTITPMTITPAMVMMGNNRANLSFTPVADANGTVTITVRANDGSGASNATFARTFRINVTPVNDPPTLDPIPNQTATGTAMRTVTLRGIRPGPANESRSRLQVVRGLTAGSSNNTIVRNRILITNFDAAAGTATLTYTPVANGTVTITVRVQDSGPNVAANGDVNFVERTFPVTVSGI